MDIKDINFAIEILSHPQSGDESDIKEAFKVAIESLKAWKENLEQEPILDKIRAEIAVLDDADYDYEGYYKAVTDAVKIIDKYRK